ncbi:MAG: tol-pal system protein YbgF [Gammaproteobacteria bacterium]|nr:MAG: tol-pal system protein YbgF [Gammaproteobacteria bacterium]
MKRFLVSVLMAAATPVVAAPEYRTLPVEQREAAPAALDLPGAAHQAPAGASIQPDQPAVPANVQWQLYNQLQQVQQELSELRGMLEQQTHQISQLKQQQRQRYLDLDHRINQLKKANPAAIAVPSVVPEADIQNPSQKPSPDTADTHNDFSDRKTYDQAIVLMRERKFESAIALLEKLLAASPNSSLVPNSEYWLGELYMVLTPPNYDVAKKHFVTLLRDHKNHQKIPDALYKLGKLYYSQGEKAKARVTLEKVISDYPTRQAASHAKKLLAKL